MHPYDDGEIDVCPPDGAFSVRQHTLPVEVCDDDEAYAFTCRLPEGCGDRVAVTLRDGELSIRVTRAADGACWCRSFTLLDPVRPEGAVALVDEGVLRIRLPKGEPTPA